MAMDTQYSLMESVLSEYPTLEFVETDNAFKRESPTLAKSIEKFQQKQSGTQALGVFAPWILPPSSCSDTIAMDRSLFPVNSSRRSYWDEEIDESVRADPGPWREFPRNWPEKWRFLEFDEDDTVDIQPKCPRLNERQDDWEDDMRSKSPISLLHSFYQEKQLLVAKNRFFPQQNLLGSFDGGRGFDSKISSDSKAWTDLEFPDIDFSVPVENPYTKFYELPSRPPLSVSRPRHVLSPSRSIYGTVDNRREFRRCRCGVGADAEPCMENLSVKSWQLLETEKVSSPKSDASSVWKSALSLNSEVVSKHLDAPKAASDLLHEVDMERMQEREEADLKRRIEECKLAELQDRGWRKTARRGLKALGYVAVFWSGMQVASMAQWKSVDVAGVFKSLLKDEKEIRNSKSSVKDDKNYEMDSGDRGSGMVQVLSSLLRW